MTGVRLGVVRGIICSNLLCAQALTKYMVPPLLTDLKSSHTLLSGHTSDIIKTNFITSSTSGYTSAAKIDGKINAAHVLGYSVTDAATARLYRHFNPLALTMLITDALVSERLQSVKQLVSILAEVQRCQNHLIKPGFVVNAACALLAQHEIEWSTYEQLCAQKCCSSAQRLMSTTLLTFMSAFAMLTCLASTAVTEM